MPRGREPPGNWGCCYIKMNLRGSHWLPQPRPSIANQSWRPKPLGRKAEAATRSSPPVRPPCATVHSCLGEFWVPRIIFYWDKHLHPLHPFCHQGLLCGRTAIHGHSSHANAQTVSKTKKATSFARLNGEHAHGQSHPDSYVGGTSPSQEVRDPSLIQVTEAQLC